MFVLPPRSPKFNDHVERAQMTYIEEFHEITDANFKISDLNWALPKWEEIYNAIRPHQALGYFTPQQFLERYQLNQRKEEMHR